MKKYVVIINGKGGVGKDTLCDIVSKKYCVNNVSSITPIKQIAQIGGWKGEKVACSHAEGRESPVLRILHGRFRHKMALYHIQEFNRVFVK